jgi:membrane protein implicated in regulation of membrane protease activity
MRGKGWRVFGYFIWMLGAGVLLDSEAAGVGGALLALGAALFAVGTAQSLAGRGAA